MQLTALLTLYTVLRDNLFLPRPRLAVPGLGLLTGTTTRSTRRARPVHGFYALPYGLPPTGRHRFSPPRPAGWLGERDAGQLKFLLSPPSCPQPRPGRPGEVTGREDCLNLSIFSPRLSTAARLPVMVFVHGGGFSRGSYTALGPAHLLDHDIVLVTMHYRLSSFGFLCLTEDTANAGLEDLLLGLSWLQRWLPWFGGDPARVTLAGESAGSAAVSWLLGSPRSAPLFSRVILLSGARHAQWAETVLPGVAGRGVASAAGCPPRPPASALRCLRSRSASTLVLSTERCRRASQARGMIGPELTAPCASPLFPDSTAVPRPALVSATRDEGTLFAALAVRAFFRPNRNRTAVPGYWQEQFLTDLLDSLQVDGSERGGLVQQYFLPGELGSLVGVLPGLAALMGRYMIKQPALQNAATAPTFLLSFEHRGEHSLFPFLAPAETRDLLDPGVTHSDDLLYVFDTGVIRLSEVDQRVTDLFTGLLVRFVYTGVADPQLPAVPQTGPAPFLLVSRGTTSVQQDFTQTFRRHR